MCLPEIADEGPDALWYAELAETQGRPWPPTLAMTRATHAALADQQARRAAELGPDASALISDAWRCPRCGGPLVCATLAATLAYRACGYAELPNGEWRHV